ncbi:MAG: hypothetical protein ACT4PE_07035, partial [Candidatus Eiseniibacteriota bacterium]
MKRWMTILVSLLVAALPTAASAQTGFYEWSVSASISDPNMTNPPNPGAGIQTLYLWLVDQCYPDASSGLAAAQLRLVSNNAPSSWAILAFTAMNGFLNAGNATDLLLASPCTTAPVVAGSVLINASGPGRVGLTLTDGTGGGGVKAAGVDCVNFAEHAWPN